MNQVFDIDDIRCRKCGSLKPPIALRDYIVKCPDCGYWERK